MQVQYIPYEQLSLFSTLVQDYVNSSPKLSDFYAYPPDLEGFRKKLTNYKFKGNREVLVTSLKNQYRNFEISPATAKNLDLLLESDTFTIATGHQLNIFTGPLYFIFKIASTLKLCRDLKKQFPDKNFVPIYWMATEDHDFEEINHTFVENKKIVWQQNTHGGAVGEIATDKMTNVVREFNNYLGLGPHSEKLSKIIEQAYLEHTNLSDATRFLVNSLFNSDGLVILDGHHKNLKAVFSAYIQEDIMHQKSAKSIEKSNTDLRNLGYKIQVQPREINFFYLDKNLRERIIFKEGKYQILNTDISFTTEELKAEIQHAPEKFSPNVVMRPLYQEVILPNLAYIGGSGEIAYWLQLKNNFDQYQIDFPIIIVRNSAIWIDKISQNYIQRASLEKEDIFKPLEVLQNEYVKKNSQKELSIENQKMQIKASIREIENLSAQINPTLATSTKALEVKMEKLLQKFEQKILKGEKRNYDDCMRQLEKLKNRLFPSGSLQERKENFSTIYKNYGDEWIQFLIENFRPLAKEITLVYEPQ